MFLRFSFSFIFQIHSFKYNKKENNIFYPRIYYNKTKVIFYYASKLNYFNMVLFFKPHCFFSTSIVLNSNRKKELVFQSYLLFLLYLLFFLRRKKTYLFLSPLFSHSVIHPVFVEQEKN